MSPPRRGSGGGAPKKGGGAPKKGGRKPLSAAAQKAVESKRARHAEASVRKADRGGTRKAATGGRGGGAGGRGAAAGGARGAGARSGGRPGPGAPRGLGGDQVEGRQAVRELLLAGRRRVREILVAEDQDDTEVLQDIVDLALDLKVPVREVTRTRLFAEARTESPQGVIAHAAELDDVELDDLARRKSSRGAPPFLLAVDGVTDPGNLGALLRSAECAGVTGVVLPKHRAVHITPTVTKAAAGAVEYLPMALVGGLPTALRQLREAGVWVIGLDAGGDTDLFDLEVADQAVCLVMGAEGKGLSRLVRERCDAVAGIPLLGQLASLNVSAAGALACFEVTRRRLASGRGS
ncbi:MAG TPA: 23S rRNA (guanosine(2251)-2'-O)-methyltransferase RlmB [Acidimicrobiales bacterium]